MESLNRIKNYAQQITALLSTKYTGSILDNEGLLCQILLTPSAGNEELEECQKYFKDKIPSEYLEFLRFSNGAILYNYEDLGGYDFLGTQALVKEDLFQREQFGEDWQENIILICRIIANAEFIGFKINHDKKYELMFCSMDSMPDTWEPIGESFDEFISTLVDEKGREYWFDKLNSDT